MSYISVMLLLICLFNVIASQPSSRDIEHDNDYIGRKQYSIKTVQTGTTYFPNDGSSHSVKVRPDVKQAKTFLSIKETKLAPNAIVHNKNWRKLRNTNNAQRHSLNRICVRCPPERTLIAQKRLDGVLMLEMPSVMSCSSRNPFSKSLYEIQTLFGKSTEFVLPAGSHSFMAHIVNVETGKEEKTCNLRINVLVRKCEPYRINSDKLKMKCDRENMWGSECVFSCKKPGKLTHSNPIVCDDDLQWSGEEPQCVSVSGAHSKRDFCILPPAPENGKFSCEIIDNQTIDDTMLAVLDGSMCKVVCNFGYVVPGNLQSFSRFYCENGHWNATMYDFCQPKRFQLTV